MRVAQQAKEQRQKRQVMLESARQKQDALRTGRTETASLTPSQMNGPSEEDLRRQRIEAMRNERVEQLRALREKRAGSQGASQSTPTISPAAPQTQPSFVHPSLPAIPVQSTPRRTPQANPQRLQRQVQQQPLRQRSVQAPHQQTSSRGQNPSAMPTRRKAGSGSSQSTTIVPDSDRLHSDVHDSLIGSTSIGENQILRTRKRDSAPQSDTQNAVSMLRSRSTVRQAIILNEILSAPIAMRSNTDSLFH